MHISSKFLWAISLVLSSLALNAYAAESIAKISPANIKRIEANYDVVRKGQPFANVTEIYQQNAGHYQLESVTKGIGIYALFGKRVLKSEGLVSKEGLQPSHFELHQGDNEKKSLYADFDWANHTLSMKVKGETSSVPLQAGTQDLLSFVYQLMFLPLKEDTLALTLTTGKKVRTYNYQVKARNEALALESGSVNTLHIANANAENVNDEKELWLSAEHYGLPVRTVMHDETGAAIEQTLTSLHVE